MQINCCTNWIKLDNLITANDFIFGIVLIWSYPLGSVNLHYFHKEEADGENF